MTAEHVDGHVALPRSALAIARCPHGQVAINWRASAGAHQLAGVRFERFVRLRRTRMLDERESGREGERGVAPNDAERRSIPPMRKDERERFDDPPGVEPAFTDKSSSPSLAFGSGVDGGRRRRSPPLSGEVRLEIEREMRGEDGEVSPDDENTSSGGGAEEERAISV